jgi:glucan 1,3-beta-glucosidase
MNVCEWHTRPEYLEHSLQVLERLAERYQQRNCLHAIEVLNEPRWDVPTDYLKNYYTQAYQRIRKFCNAADVAVIFHDGFRSFREYLGFMQGPEFDNVVFDIHRYQCFERSDIDRDIYGHIQKTAVDWRDEADAINSELLLPTISGEWSLGLDLKVVSLWAAGPFNHALQGMDAFQQNVASRAYGDAQLMTFEKYLGWFFWSYKTETTTAWCFRECVARGWLPANYS